MKTRIAVGAGLLLTIGSAVAGTLMYGQGRAEPIYLSMVVPAVVPGVQQQSQSLRPEVAMPQATASSGDYIAPRAPI